MLRHIAMWKSVLQIMGQGRRSICALLHGLLERIVEISYLKSLNLEGMSVPWRTFHHGCGAFLSEKAIQMSSCTYLMRVFQAVTALIIVLIIASSSCPSISWLCWHSPAECGQGAGSPDFFYIVNQVSFLRKCDLKRIFLVQYRANSHLGRQQCSPGMWCKCLT